MRVSFLLLALVAAAANVWSEPEAPDAVVLWLNGVAVTRVAWADACAEVRGQPGNADAASCRRAALDRCVHDLVLEEWAATSGGGLREHAARVASWQAENDARLRSRAAGQTVFGPVPLRWEQYRRLRRDRLELAVKKRLETTEQPTEAELRRFHAEHPGLFTTPRQGGPIAYESDPRYVRKAFEQERFARRWEDRAAAVEIRWNMPADQTPVD